MSDEPKTGMYSDDYRVEPKIPMKSEGTMVDHSDHPKITMKPDNSGQDKSEVVYVSNEKPAVTAEKNKKQLLTEPAPSPLEAKEEAPVAETPAGSEEAKEAKGEATESQGEAAEGEKQLLNEEVPKAEEKPKGKKK